MTDTPVTLLLIGSGVEATRIAALASDDRQAFRIERIEDATTELDTIRVPVDALIIEDIDDHLDGRARALSRITSAAPAGTVVACCVSTEPITELAAKSATPERIVGFRLWPNFDRPRFAEVVKGMLTDAEAAARFQRLCAGMSLGSVIVPDRPGALLDGLVRPYLNQVVRALDEGLASAADIDSAIHLGLGYPTGPLQLLQRTGLQAHLDVCASLYEQTGDHRFKAPPLLQRLVAAGRTGPF